MNNRYLAYVSIYGYRILIQQTNLTSLEMPEGMATCLFVSPPLRASWGPYYTKVCTTVEMVAG